MCKYQKLISIIVVIISSFIVCMQDTYSLGEVQNSPATEFRLGTVAYNAGNYQSALEHFQKAEMAYELWASVLQRRQATPKLVVVYEFLILSIEKIGDCYYYMDNEDQARSQYNKALDSIHRLRTWNERAVTGRVSRYIDRVTYRLYKKLGQVPEDIEPPPPVPELPVGPMAVPPLPPAPLPFEAPRCPDDAGNNGLKIGILPLIVYSNSDHDKNHGLHSAGVGLNFDLPLFRHELIGEELKLGWDMNLGVSYSPRSVEKDDQRITNQNLSANLALRHRLIFGPVVPFFTLGASFNFTLGSTLTRFNPLYYKDKTESDYSANVDTVEVAPMIGTGLDFPFVAGSLRLEVLYEIGLMKTVHGTDDPTQEVESYIPRNVRVQFGYNFHLTPCPLGPEYPPVKLGLAGGLNFSRTSNTNTTNRMAAAGLFLFEYLIDSNFSTIWGIGYLQRGFKAEDGTAKADFITVPIWFSVRFPLIEWFIPHLIGGFNFNYLSSAQFTSAVDGEDYDFEHGFQPSYLNVVIGAGVGFRLPFGEVGLEAIFDTSIGNSVRPTQQITFQTYASRTNDLMLLIYYKVPWDDFL